MDSVTVLFYVIVFLFGITVGSFCNVCIYRIPKKESIVTVPSHCMSCGRRLRWYELIPLFSYIGLRGRCAGCGARISPQYPVIEASNGLLWVLVFWRVGSGPAVATLTCLLVSALLVLSVIDARTLDVPPGAVIFILVLGGLRLLFDLQHWPLYLIGLFAVSVPLGLVWFLSGGRAVGGGDVKLMAACGLFLGWKLIVFAFLAGCVLGAVIHCLRMVFAKAGRTLAMVPYLSAGVVLAALFGSDLLAWYFSLF